MTWGVDAKIVLGEVSVAALSRYSVQTARCGASALVMGSKRPVAFLFHKGETRLAVRPDGTALPPDDLIRLCPGAWQLFENAPDIRVAQGGA